jgi:hypothetical protein
MRIRKLLLAGGLALAATAASIVAIGPTAAFAAGGEACTPNNRTFNIPNDPDVDVYIQMCIYKDGNFRGGFARVYWDVNSWPYDHGKLFDAFVVQVRTERYDTATRTVTCDLTNSINSDDHGYSLCTTTAYTSVAQNAWSGDGKVTYNIDGDGNGNYTWDLSGSPRVT